MTTPPASSARFGHLLRTHQYIYLPAGASDELTGLGPDIALMVQSIHHLSRLTVVAPADVEIPKSLRRRPRVTDRSPGPIYADSVVYVHLPTLRSSRLFTPLTRHTIVLAEARRHEFLGWARLNRALDLETGQTQRNPLRADGIRILDEIVSTGRTMWREAEAQRQTCELLNELKQIGQYDRPIIETYARKATSERFIAPLYDLLDRFEGSRTP